MVGERDAEAAKLFMSDLKDRLANRIQLTTDGHRAYLDAVEDAFGGDIDYADAGEAVRAARRQDRGSRAAL
jgi:hypothetical protein